MKKVFQSCLLMICIILSGCSNKMISETKARDIALKDAKVDEKEITFINTEIDDDEYQFIFQSDTMKYEYEIDRKDGRIESKKCEMIVSSISPSNNSNTPRELQLISQDEAKQIAFGQFQINESEVFDLEIEFDDEVIPYYEIEFEAGKTEYSIKINAQTKAVIEKKIDY